MNLFLLFKTKLANTLLALTLCATSAVAMVPAQNSTNYSSASDNAPSTSSTNTMTTPTAANKAPTGLDDFDDIYDSVDSNVVKTKNKDKDGEKEPKTTTANLSTADIQHTILHKLIAKHIGFPVASSTQASSSTSSNAETKMPKTVTKPGKVTIWKNGEEVVAPGPLATAMSWISGCFGSRKKQASITVTATPCPVIRTPGKLYTLLFDLLKEMPPELIDIIVAYDQHTFVGKCITKKTCNIGTDRHISGLIQLTNGPLKDHLATSSLDGTITIHNPETGECVKTITANEGNGNHLWESWDGLTQLTNGFIAIGSCSEIRIIDPVSDKQVGSIPGYHSDVRNIIQLTDGRIAFTKYDYTTTDQVAIYNQSNGTFLGLNYKRVPKGTNLLQLANGDLAVGTSQYIKTWNVITGDCICFSDDTTHTHEDRPVFIVQLIDGRIATTSKGCCDIRIWNLGPNPYVKTLSTEGCLDHLWSDDRYECVGNNNCLIELSSGLLLSKGSKHLANNVDERKNPIIRIWNPLSEECIQIIVTDIGGHFDHIIQLSDGHIASDWRDTSDNKWKTSIRIWR